QITGVVVSAGKMQKAVKVQIAQQEWNKKIRKHFASSTTHLVSDPNSSLREGDVVRIASGFRTSRNIRHVVAAIIAPFGPPVEARPPVPTAAELLAIRAQKRIEKDVRQAARGRVASAARVKEAEARGLPLPSLEEATRKIKALAEQERARAMKGQPAVRSGLSAKEKRMEKRNLTDGERAAIRAERE
ncbi:nucleic acid-binding protein, partial [Lophium mytilinum]